MIENLLGRARERLTVSIDPNLRTQLIPAISYRQRIDVWAALSDILRLSEDDLDQLWPGWTPEQAAEHLHKLGVALVVVSLGCCRGVRLASAEPACGCRSRPPPWWTPSAPGTPSTPACCTTSPEHGVLGGRLETLTPQTLEQALRFASRVAAINCSRPGADPPWHTELT